jgi:hypothetical protein
MAHTFIGDDRIQVILHTDGLWRALLGARRFLSAFFNFRLCPTAFTYGAYLTFLVRRSGTGVGTMFQKFGCGIAIACGYEETAARGTDLGM